jgi:hypothetical protein
MKIDNAGAKHISAVDYGIGDVCFTSALQSIDKLTIKRVETKFNFWFSQSSSKIARHVPEGSYAEFLGHELEVRMAADSLSHCLRQAYILGDHVAIPHSSDLL